MRISGIYKIVHIASGRCYVGQSQDINFRWSCHKRDLEKGHHIAKFLQRSWQKYGESQFEFTILEECPLCKLDEREQFWMDELEPEFNSCRFVGSTRGFKHSEETKARMRAGQNTPEVRAKKTAALKGRVFSEESKAKMSAAKLGKAQTEEHRRKGAISRMGKKISPETRLKMSLANKAAWQKRKEATK